MNRLMIFAILLFESAVVFSQSTGTTPVSPQAVGNEQMGQWPLEFSHGRPAQIGTGPTFKSFDCHGRNTTQNQASAPIDFDHLFSAPCTDLKPHVELFAHNEIFSSQSPLDVPPQLKGEPIPTQWPNAKLEKIPTRWPNLKLRPIDEGSQGLVPAQGKAK
jgi:hypothetical protein